MKLNLSNNLIISGTTYQQRAVIQKALSLKNPTYDVMVRHNNLKALYVVKEYFRYYKLDKDKETLVTGRGVYRMVKKMFPLEEIEFKTNLCRDKLSFELPKNVFKLRDYQEGSIEEIIKHYDGIINLDTGWGKTYCALKLIEETQLKTLIVVPRLSILAQFVGDLKKLYNYESGVINGKKFDVKDITVASIQTLKLRDLSVIKDKFGMVIFDECHTTISDKGMKIITTFNPLRLYGMSASPDRSDGQGEAVKFYFGQIIIKRDLPTVKPTVEIVKCFEDYSGLDKKDMKNVGDEYHSIIENQVNNEARNRLISNIIKEEIRGDRRVLVLTKRVSHYIKINELLSGLKCHSISSGLNSSDSDEQDLLLDKLRNGFTEFNVIMGTYSMLSTGVNIPALDTLLLAGDLKSDILSKQATGRILRIFENKKTPKIIDIDDCKSGILHNQARKRKRFYLENSFIIL